MWWRPRLEKVRQPRRTAVDTFRVAAGELVPAPGDMVLLEGRALRVRASDEVLGTFAFVVLPEGDVPPDAQPWRIVAVHRAFSPVVARDERAARERPAPETSFERWLP